MQEEKKKVEDEKKVVEDLKEKLKEAAETMKQNSQAIELLNHNLTEAQKFSFRALLQSKQAGVTPAAVGGV